MAIIERDVVLQGKTADGKETIDLPITALKNIEDTAEIKENPTAEDFIPIIDFADNGQMKKTPFKLMEQINNIGRRNYLMVNIPVTYTSNGVTVVRNTDNSLTFTGKNTAAAGAFVMLWNLQTGIIDSIVGGQYINNKKWIPNGDYILSGGSEFVAIQVATSEDNTSDRSIVQCIGDDVSFTVTDEHKYVWCRILIRANADFGAEGVTVYPMIRSAEISDSTYVPYSKTGVELTNDVSINVVPDDVSILDYASTLTNGRHTAYTRRTNTYSAANLKNHHFVYDIYVYNPLTIRVNAYSISASGQSIRYSCVKNSGNWSNWFDPNIHAVTDDMSVKDYADTLPQGRYTAFTFSTNTSGKNPPVKHHFVYDIYIYSNATARIDALSLDATGANVRYACIKNSGTWRDWTELN